MRTCPGCQRATYWPTRVGNFRVKPKDLPEGIVAAVISDGSCMTCYRITKGMTRPTTKGVTVETQATYRRAMTESDIKRAREELKQMWADRRRRGVNPDGQDPRTLHRPGLTLLEV